MIHIENKEIYSDNPEMLVCKAGAPISSAFICAHVANVPNAADYIEVPRSEYEAALKAEEVDRKYRELARRNIAAKYDTADECKVLRRTLNAILNPEAATLEEDGENAVPDVVAKFAEYNAYVEKSLAKAKEEAPKEVEREKEMERQAAPGEE